MLPWVAAPRQSFLGDSVDLPHDPTPKGKCLAHQGSGLLDYVPELWSVHVQVWSLTFRSSVRAFFSPPVYYEPLKNSTYVITDEIIDELQLQII